MDYTLEVTFKCNWFCTYCSADTHNREIITMNQIFKNIESIENGGVVSITGGEPGMLKTSTLETIFKKLKEKNCEIHVNTNGLFFKKTELFHYVSGFLYHCSEELDINDELYFNKDLDILYELTVHDDNVEKLESFLNKYKEIKFFILGADEIPSKKGYSPSLNKKNRLRLVSKFKNKIHPGSIKPLIMTSKGYMEYDNIKRLGYE